MEPKMIIKVEAIVREDKLDDVIDALTAIEVNGISVSQVMGHGVQKGYTELVRGQEVIVSLTPKLKFEIVVSSEEWETKVIETIRRTAYTGEVGDGKIFSYGLREALRIRTGEKGYEALNP
jgi:nitrogen regulatory protein P-II 1